MRIRIRYRDNGHMNSNCLKLQGLLRMFREKRWRVIRTGNRRSAAYADPPNHC